MYLWLLVAVMVAFLLLYPLQIHFYTSGVLRGHVTILGFIKIRFNLVKMFKKFFVRGVHSKKSEAPHFNPIEIVENFKKMVSARPFLADIQAKTTVTELSWYSAIPMDNPVLGLSLLPIYTTAQTLLLDYLYLNFASVRDYDLDTKYNYLTEDVFIYFHCILSINLLNILLTCLKYIRKLPLLIKRTT